MRRQFGPRGRAMLERFGARALTVGFAAATLLMVVLGMALGSLAAVAACMALLGVALGMAASGGIAATSQSLPAALQSSALGWAMGVGRLGQVALPLLMGLALQRGIAAGWVLAASAVLPLAGAVAALLLPRPIRPAGMSDRGGGQAHHGGMRFRPGQAEKMVGEVEADIRQDDRGDGWGRPRATRPRRRPVGSPRSRRDVRDAVPVRTAPPPRLPLPPGSRETRWPCDYRRS